MARHFSKLLGAGLFWTVLIGLGCGTGDNKPGQPDGTVVDVRTDGTEHDVVLDLVPDHEGKDDIRSDSDAQPVDSVPDKVIPDVEDTKDVHVEDTKDVRDVPEQEIEDQVDDGPQDVADLDVAIQDLAIDLPPVSCVMGEACDDLNPCSMNDQCLDGICVGEPYMCDDGRSCTMDACDGTGNCAYSLLVGKCLVNGICAKIGDAKPDDVCRFCDPIKDPFSWTLKPFAPCDDGSKCTYEDQCKDGVCVGQPLTCPDDGNPCTKSTCNPELGCVQKPNNISCEDGNLCTTWDYCTGGECMGGPTVSCDDFNPCTDDYCSPDKGCYHMNLDGNPCDDGDACTLDDECEDGLCEPGSEALHCEDWTDCTDDLCDVQVGCIYPLNGNPCCIGNTDINYCDDKDPCTIDSCNVLTGECVPIPNQGACTDGDLCTYADVCSAGKCAGLPLNCDDQNPCTLDFCNSLMGCVHEPLSGACDDHSVCTLNDWCVDGKCKGVRVDCNDYNFCTDDLCDPVLGCKYAFNSAPCNDYNLCTTNDQCTVGLCKGSSKACDDGNACTSDSCVSTVGCQNLFNTNVCDDGNPCTEGDLCNGGVCKSGLVVCYTCDYDFSDSSNRVKSMKISADKKPENALDLNGDGQPDNSMAGLANLANGPLADSLDGGDIHLLFEHHLLKTDGNIYTLAVFLGEIAAGYETCDFTTQYCGYTASPDAIDLEQCESMVTFKNATIFNGVLQAGGPSAIFPWSIPISAGTVINIVLYRATLRATVAIQGGLVVGMSGVLGGAIPKQAFIDAVNALPEEGLPLPKSMIIQMVQGMIQNDIDTNGDGAADAASIAIKFESIPAGILGIK